MFEILPDLWVSNKNHTIPISNNIININSSNDLKYLSSFTNDELKVEELYNYIKIKIKYINTQLADNNTIVVSCNSGKQLSPLLVISYIINYSNMDLITIIQLFKTKNEDIIIDDNYFKEIITRIYNNKHKNV